MVLLSPHLEAKLCDFGLARMKSELMTGVDPYPVLVRGHSSGLPLKRNQISHSYSEKATVCLVCVYLSLRAFCYFEFAFRGTARKLAPGARSQESG